MDIFKKIKKETKEEQVMAQVEEHVEEQVVQSSVEMTHKAYSFYKDANGKWRFVTISYNPVANAIGQIDASPVGDDKAHVQEQFKIAVARDLFPSQS